MPTAKMNVSALYTALDRKRQLDNISWRQLAVAADLSPSTLSRIRNGDARPNVDAYLALTSWLGVEPGEFVDREIASSNSAEDVDFSTQISSVLRARTDLTEQDKAYLEDLITLTIKRIQAER
jgi:transcriptional regulator with XRE-family HTH domain